jgi:2-methylcitrate dehydratase
VCLSGATALAGTVALASERGPLEACIAERVAGMRDRDLDASLLHLLKRSILDSYAGICGSLSDLGMLEKFDRLASDAESRTAAVWGIDQRAGLAEAVFMNSILGRRSDLLNTFVSPNDMGASHPSDNVALVLTLADHLGTSGRDVISTVYVAFTLSAAFSTYYDADKANYDHDATATFYAALTIGYALGLSAAELTTAQQVAGMFGLDINQAGVGQITDWKHCTYASAAMRAIAAVRIVRAGFEAPPNIYRGAAGVDQFFPHADAFFEPAPDLERIIFKRWPALVFCQTPIDVALDLAAKGIDPQSVTSVEVRTYAFAIVNGLTDSAYHPDSRAARTHSIPYCVATALLKPIGYSDFDEPRSRDETLQALITKVKVVEDQAFTADYPSTAPCEITVTFADGSSATSSRKVPRGDPSDPLSDDDLSAKLRTYFTFARDDDEREDVIRRLWNLEAERDLNWLLEPLRRRRLAAPDDQAGPH